MLDDKSIPAIYSLLEKRNYEGKTSLMLAIEHERNDIIDYLLSKYKQLDFDKQDSVDGNSSLHIACLKENYLMAQRIFQ